MGTHESLHIVFSSRASYSPLIILLCALAPTVTLLSLIRVNTDDFATEAEKKQALSAVGWTTVAIFILYLFVFPKRFEVWSNASIKVITWPSLAYTFANATVAYMNPPLSEGFCRARIKFATALSKRVVVRRGNGGWDLIISPVDPDGFVKAVLEVTGGSEVEASTSEGI